MKRTKRMKTFSSILLLIFLFLITGCTGTVPTNNTPTINSIPITSSLVGALYTYNVEATDTDGDTLTYSLTSSPMGMTIDSSTGVISWTPDAAGDYNVILKVSDGELFDTQSFTITISVTGITTLSPPTGVTASDSIVNKVQITWNTVSGASHYQVYRADALLGSKTAISGWQTGTSYDDTTVTAETTYYYWVKAATSSSGDNASDYSSSDTGSSIVFSIYPSPPTNVSASDGTYTDKVRITWNTVSGATHYRVYRASFSSGLGRSAISGWQTSTSYDDTTVTPGTNTYYYWVKAATSSSGDNASDYSEYDSGFASVMLPPPSPPTNVSASDGTYTDKVRITWNTVSGATHYRVYRASFSSGLGRSAISGWQTSTSYDDTTVTPGTNTYYYWVKAATSSSGDNASDYSEYDSGFASVMLPPPSPPTNVSASDGTYTDKVRITWNTVSGATHYRVYRASFSSGLGRSAISGWQTSTSYDDTTVTPGTNTYYYWVKAATSSSGDNASDYSEYDSGFASVMLPPPSPPTNVSASDGTYTDKVRITWNTVSGATHYRVYRASFSSGLGRSAISGWQTSTSYDDTTVTPGTNTYYYWVKAATSSSGDNASDYSEYDSGFASVMLPPPSPPTNVSASDGTYTDKVRITWNTVSGATHYRVYRASFSSGLGRSAISGWQTSTSYDDTTVTPGTNTYYYWVKAATSSSGDNASDYSEYDSGFASVMLP